MGVSTRRMRPRGWRGASRPAATTPELPRFRGSGQGPQAPGLPDGAVRQLGPRSPLVKSSAAHRRNQRGDPWRGASPVLVSSGVEVTQTPLLTPVGGLGCLHNQSLFQSPIFALLFSSKGPGQLPGEVGQALRRARWLEFTSSFEGHTCEGRFLLRAGGHPITPKPPPQTWVAPIALELCRPGWTRTPEILLPLPSE